MPTVRIIWGERPDPDDEPGEYTFETEELLNAFLEGVDAAVGWLDHIQLDEGESYCFEHGETYTDACPECSEGEE